MQRTTRPLAGFFSFRASKAASVSGLCNSSLTAAFLARRRIEPEPSTINEKTIADFTRVVEQAGILERGMAPTKEAAN
jgi:hypothetical protein